MNALKQEAIELLREIAKQTPNAGNAGYHDGMADRLEARPFEDVSEEYVAALRSSVKEMKEAVATKSEYERWVARREQEIKDAIAEKVRNAVTEFLADDATVEKLGVKYVQRTATTTGMVLRAGFKDGIGIDVKVETAYLPNMKAVV